MVHDDSPAAAKAEALIESLPWLQLLAGFDVVVVATSFIVFEYLLEE